MIFVSCSPSRMGFTFAGAKQQQQQRNFSNCCVETVEDPKWRIKVSELNAFRKYRNSKIKYIAFRFM